MNIILKCEVTDEHKQKHEIEISTIDIEELVVAKAKAKGIKGYTGRVLRHLDETILSVKIYD